MYEIIHGFPLNFSHENINEIKYYFYEKVSFIILTK